jgi:hypothetical protein
VLGWKPTVTFEGLVDAMVDADLELVREEIGNGGRKKPKITAVR